MLLAYTRAAVAAAMIKNFLAVATGNRMVVVLVQEAQRTGNFLVVFGDGDEVN